MQISLTKECRQKISNTLKGRHISPKTEFKKGHKYKHSIETIEKIRNKMLGRKLTPEHINKIAETKKAKGIWIFSAKERKIYQKQYQESHKEQFKEYRERNKERIKAQLRKSHAQPRKDIFSILGAICVKCGFNDWRALQIDHINGGGRKHLKKFSYPAQYYRAILTDIKQGSKEYQILCANCNQIKRHECNEWGGA